MGTLIGHVGPGFGFLLIGLWHMFSHIKSHSLNPNSYTSSAWFPTSVHRHLELFLIMVGCTMSIAMELFIGPDRHQPLDPDWTIPSNHLHNFEHSLISFTFFTYAAFAVAFDRFLKVKAAPRDGLTHLLAALAFGQQLLLFHMHSADHVGVEGQYHLLLQLVVLVSIVTSLMGIGHPKSFLVGYVRSVSILFQGVWFIAMGYFLWTPALVAKGCRLNSEEGHSVVRCDGEKALHRAKSLVNIQFSWFLVCVVVFSMGFYLFLVKTYGEKAEYSSVLNEDIEDVESQKNKEEYHSFVHMGKGMAPIDIER